jgi:hypothetical protein
VRRNKSVGVGITLLGTGALYDTMQMYDCIEAGWVGGAPIEHTPN